METVDASIDHTAVYLLQMLPRLQSALLPAFVSVAPEAWTLVKCTDGWAELARASHR